MSSSSRGVRLLGDLLVSLAVAGVLLAAVEATLRLAGFEYAPPSPITIWTPARDVELTRTDSMYRFHPYWFWEPRPAAPVKECPGERINSAGFRGPERPRARSDGTVRIVTLGDSTTFGVGVCWNQTYSAVLEHEIPGSEVLDFGVTGFTTFQGEKLLVERALAYDPKVVLAAFGACNEQFAASPHPVEAKFAITSRTSPRMAAWRGHLRRLRIFQAIERVVATPPDRAQRGAGLVNWAKWYRGSRDYTPNQSVPSFERSLEAIVADARAAFRAAPDADTTLLADDWHPSAEGHRFYGRFLAGKLRSLLDGVPSSDCPPSSQPQG